MSLPEVHPRVVRERAGVAGDRRGGEVERMAGQAARAFGATEIYITDIADDRDPRLDVGDAGSVVGGRGLQLVVALAAEWGVDTSGPGKSVWARLPVPPGWPPAADCPCATGSTRLSSGRSVAPG